MRSVLLTLAQAFGIVLLADFVAGVIHWLEDAYFTEDTPVIGPAFIKPNIVHHHLPRYFTKLSWWQSSASLLAVGVALLAAGWCFGFLSWQLWLFVVVAVNANQIHKWAHRTRKENGPIISFLQDIRLLQTTQHHALHHTDPKNTYYCPVTNFLNPVLERIAFWPRLEAVIERVTGIKHRDDTSNRGAGPGPEWLTEFRPKRTVKPAAATKPATAIATSPAVGVTPAAAPVVVPFTAEQAAHAAHPVSCDCSKCMARDYCAKRQKQQTLQHAA